jgi:HEAT repeat protein
LPILEPRLRHQVQHVRVAALRYLALMPNVVRYDAIHPQRARVLRELFKALDDPKKAVRRHAVDARYVPSCHCPLP